MSSSNNHLSTNILETDLTINNKPYYSASEEMANTLSHALGIIAGIIGLIFMVIKGQNHLDSLQLFGVVIYGISIITLFTCSTLYHGITKPKLKKAFKLADHLAIYLLIAGTYTPLMLISLNSVSAKIVLAAIWLLAIGGIVFKVLFLHKFEKLSLAIYLTMGWLCVAVGNQLVANLSSLGFILLLAGGLFYSLGVIFYATKKIPFNHAIWHLFVLLGAVSHFLCIYLTVL